MTELERIRARVVAPDAAVADAARRLLDGKTKPRGSLGRIEELAVWYAAVRADAAPPLPAKAIVVMGGDHGVADEGVSAYPAEVTRQMMRNFADGGAAINVLARQAQARVVVVDMGTRAPAVDHPSILSRRIGDGTASFVRGPAMTRAQAERAIAVGVELASALADEGVTLLGIGEMGIGNSSAASAITAALLNVAPAEVVGRGTGVDDAGLARKLEAVRRGLEVNRPDGRDPVDVLAKMGGFEIAGLAGVVLGAAARRVAVVVDGFIAGAAALAAVRLCPAARGHLAAGHCSVEPGHRLVLNALDLRPLLTLDLRLGEGTGAALALALVEAGVRVLGEMATFAGAGVTDAGR
jgi:nicotinate-nucleotide--dimethylbenzimidazole phosphoribosyltransferase